MIFNFAVLDCGMRVLIGFFGITRSLRLTADSIAAAFFEPLRRAGIQTLRAGHFNLPETIDNPRSGEISLVPDRGESALLGLDLCWQERQDDDHIAVATAVGRAFPDRFGDAYRSLTNLCHQLRSLDRLWTMMQLFEPAPDDLVLLLRPDLRYLDALEPAAELACLRDGRADLIVPAWQSWGGLNDRFAFCTVAAAAHYAMRLQDFVPACLALDGMHSERFLAFVAERHGLRVAGTTLRAIRVRANGQVARNDAGLLMAA